MCYSIELFLNLDYFLSLGRIDFKRSAVIQVFSFVHLFLVINILLVDQLQKQTIHCIIWISETSNFDPIGLIRYIC